VKTTYTIQEVMALASAIVHFDEFVSSNHPTDLQAARATLAAPSVAEIMSELDKASCLPLRRDGVGYRLP
jgi:hypothetical protein